jgi:hypothetical protein
LVKLSAAGQTERGKELTPARLFALELWKENLQITALELGKALKEKGFEVAKSTYSTWLIRFKKGKSIRTYDGKDLRAVKPSEITPAVKPSEITLEQIIKTAGSVEALSLLFYQGVMEELRRLISQLKHELGEVTKERNRIMREYNEKIAKLKLGTLTLDQVEHRLIPKSSR